MFKFIELLYPYMSIAKRLFGWSDTETVDEPTRETQEETNSWVSDDVAESLLWLEDGAIKPAYDMTREQSFSFPETVTIYSESGDEGRVQIETPTVDMEFTVRLSGYTSRFGELDVTYITVGGFALDLYHALPNSEGYFVRRLYYYDDESGIGGEQHSDNRDAPHNPDWSRNDIGKSVTITNTDAHLRVYDWRENMLTHDKPTPDEGEVVFRYQDSPNSGGNRDRTNIVLTVSDLQFASGDSIDVEFIEFDSDAGELVLYAGCGSEWVVGRVSASKQPSVGEIEWTTESEYHRPSQLDSLVWVRDPADTWHIPSLRNQKTYI